MITMALLGGCQLLAKLKNHQCESDEDCITLLGTQYTCDAEYVCARQEQVDSGPTALPEQWQCLRENLPTYPPLTAEERANPALDIALLLRDFSSGEIVMNSTGRSCGPSDLNCTNALEEGLTPDSEGYTHFSVPYGFAGRFRFEIPGRLSTTVYISRPILRNYRTHGGSAVTQETMDALLAGASTDVPNETGVALFLLYDCNEEAAEGVRLVSTAFEDSLPFYFDGPFPDQQLTESRLTTALAYDASPLAVGGFYDTPSFTTYEAYLASTDDFVSRVGIDVRANEMTLVLMYPGDN